MAAPCLRSEGQSASFVMTRLKASTTVRPTILSASKGQGRWHGQRATSATAAKPIHVA